MKDILSEKIYKLTYDGLSSLVESCYLSQRVEIARQGSRFVTYSALQNDKEFCTVKFCSSRKSGHTYALCKLVFDTFDNVVFIVSNIKMAIDLKKKFIAVNNEHLHINREYETSLWASRLGITEDINCHFLSINQLESSRGQFAQVEAVICDCASLLKGMERNMIYSNFGPCMKPSPNRFFIFAE